MSIAPSTSNFESASETKKTKKSSFTERMLERASGTVSSVLHQARAASSSDPYVTVKLDHITQTTKPVQNGGTAPSWTHDLNNRLSFPFPYNTPLPKAVSHIEIDVYDQDIMSDAHIGSAKVNLDEVFEDWISRNQSRFVTKCMKCNLEVSLRRKADNAIAGFVQIKLEYLVGQSTSESKETESELVVTIESASDLWDPNDSANWIPDEDDNTTPLWLATLQCLVYYIVGALIFCNIESWTLVDALYFATCTFATVGYGDVVPKTDGGKLFACIYMIVGISLISVALVRIVLAVYDACVYMKNEATYWFNYCCKRNSIHDENCDDVENGDFGGKHEMVDVIHGNKSKDEEEPSLKYLVVQMILSLLGMIGVGTTVYCSFEGLSFVDGIYMSTATVATVGYGDITPKSQGARLFGIIWIIASYVVILQSLHKVVDKSHDDRLTAKRTSVLNKDMSRSAILNMDKDGDGELTRLEFLEFFIVKLKLCTIKQLDSIKERFEQLEQERTARKRVFALVGKVRQLSDSGEIVSETAAAGWGKTKKAVQEHTGHEIKNKRPDVLRVMSREISSRHLVLPVPEQMKSQKTQSSVRLDSRLKLPSPTISAKKKHSLLFNESKKAGKTIAPEDTSSGDSLGDSEGDSGSRNTKVDSVHEFIEHSHPLSSVIAHIRRASELARIDVDNNIRDGKTVEAKASVKLLRSLITLLHASQKEFLPRLKSDDPERRKIRY